MKLASLLALLIGVLAQGVAAAHLLNAESYTADTWKADIASAKAAGIDGFALVSVPPNCQARSRAWQLTQIKNAYSVAANQRFQMMLSFDMSYYRNSSNCPTGLGWNMTYMSCMIGDVNKSPATFRWNNSVLISTYDGGLYGEAFFSQLKSLLDRQDINLSIAPYLSSYVEAAHKDDNPSAAAARALSHYPSIDGYFNAQAWPYDVRQNLSGNVDNAFKGALKTAGRNGPFIMAVSPWLYQDLGTAKNSTDSFVQYSDTLFYHRWGEVINDVRPDIVNIISWNNYTASTYLRDVPEANSTQPGSVDLGRGGNYVYGMNHSAWRTMSAYYAESYKTRSQPNITKNHLLYWYRVHRKNISCKGGNASASAPVKNSDFPDDSVFIWAAVRANVDIEIYFGTDSSSNSMRPGSPKVKFNTANQTKPWLFELPFPADFPRNSSDKLYPQVVVDPSRTAYAKYDSVAITADCNWQNYNAVIQSLGSDFNLIM